MAVAIIRAGQHPQHGGTLLPYHVLRLRSPAWPTSNCTSYASIRSSDVSADGRRPLLDAGGGHMIRGVTPAEEPVDLRKVAR